MKIELLFAAAGLFALVWAITGNGRWPSRLVAIAFGAIVLLIGVILSTDEEDDHSWH